MSNEIAELRAIVAAMPPAPEGMGPYLARVSERAYTVTDAGCSGFVAAGYSEEEIFERTVAVAVAEGLRRLDAGLGGNRMRLAVVDAGHAPDLGRPPRLPDPRTHRVANRSGS